MHFDPCIWCRICSICTAMLNKSQVDISVLTWALLQVCRQLYLSGGIISRNHWGWWILADILVKQVNRQLRKQWIAEKKLVQKATRPASILIFWERFRSCFTWRNLPIVHKQDLGLVLAPWSLCSTFYFGILHVLRKIVLDTVCIEIYTYIYMCMSKSCSLKMFMFYIYAYIILSTSSVLQRFDSFRDCLRLPDKAMVAMKIETHDTIPSQSTGWRCSLFDMNALFGTYSC